jgi:hypothetical protein
MAGGFKRANPHNNHSNEAPNAKHGAPLYRFAIISFI